MKKTRLASSIAAALALGVAVTPQPAPAPATTTVTAPGQQGNQKAPVTVSPISSAQTVRMLSDYVPLVSERRSAIWLGTAKRGARRHRARWNYGR